MNHSIHPPRQKRSEKTLANLLAATIQAIDEEGLNGAKIPRIVALAGVAPASVYRRFVIRMR
jgi:AcrR family transcriptional regulator